MRASLFDTRAVGQNLLLLMALVYAAMLAHNHWQIITLPTPLDIYEGLMPLITGLIAEGKNPYTFEFQPVYDNFYPPLYNMLVAPLTAWFSNDYVLHRAVNAVFIAASLGLCFYLVYSARPSTARRGHALVLATMAATLLYAALIFYSTPIASTNALGVLLLMLSVFIPWHHRFSR